MRRFYSIEYVDLEGDPNVKHAFMNAAELAEFTSTLAQLGAEDVRVNDLTPPAVDRAVAVMSGYENEPLLGAGPRRSFG